MRVFVIGSLFAAAVVAFGSQPRADETAQYAGWHLNTLTAKVELRAAVSSGDLIDRAGGFADDVPAVTVRYFSVNLAQAVDDEDDVNDPIEPVNRFIFGFNEILWQYVIGPVARTYNEYMPEPVRSGVSNFLDNLRSPVTLANDLLQLDGERAQITASRMLVNTILGVGGIGDVAKDFGLEEHKEDFGQTLGVWGVGEMFYIVLPIFGPSNPRDAVGRFVVDGYFDPMGYYLTNTHQTELSYARTGVSGLVSFAGVVDDIDELRKSSVDFYGAMRSLYRQKRQADIANGEVQEDNIPDFNIEFKELSSTPK